MVSTVKSRPNHYEVLGLKPAASVDEIAHAFAVRMSPFSPHSMTGAAQIGLAYETLRHPAKRRAYDASLGLRPAEQPGYSFAVAIPLGAAPFIGATDPLHRPASRTTSQAVPKAPSERATGSSIAQTLRELARPTAYDGDSLAEQERRANVRVDVQPQLQIEQALKAGPIEWKRPALVVGGFVLAAGLIGTFAGLSVKDAEDQQRPSKPAVSVALPAARPHPNSAFTPSPSVAEVAETQPLRPAADGSVARARRGLVSGRTSHVAHRGLSDSRFVASAIDESGSDVAAADQTEAQAPATADRVPASLPLSNKVIVHTIERIGYACGDVASTDAVEGSGGTFKVTCSSGATYQATPVHGRYHFRRMGGH